MHFSTRATFVNGAVFWMGSQGGFFVFDGTVKSLPSLVEDLDDLYLILNIKLVMLK